ncbi:hypothetical protein ACN20G_28025 (plasmid) [Streptomyces sp. BI20]|uniref:hypothetical protein n=1 Tax=Streptomyces sp. BI20 TaxID=3403460 RepID=UPI003C7950D0
MSGRGGLDPYRLASLRTQADRAHQAVAGLTVNSPRHAVRAVATALQEAFRTAHALGLPVATGCTTHPAGPVDPDPPRGRTPCLLCNNRLRRITSGIPRQPDGPT